MLEIIKQPWPWYVAGPMIALVMFILLILGRSFGVSSSFRHTCSALGAGNKHEFFNYNWKDSSWNLLFVFGIAIGGFLAAEFLSFPTQEVCISPETKSDLIQLGITNFQGLLPPSLFGNSALASPASWIILLVGGFLVGFGTRYAGGCTSGHAISGLSNFQKQSFIAVIGFFIGGLFMTHFILPIIL